MVEITFLDVIVSIIIVFIGLGSASKKTELNIKEKPYYKYYKKGLLYKLVGATFFCLIYLLYYKGGDTTNYFKGATAMRNLFWKSPSDYLFMLFHINDGYAWDRFDEVTGYPPTYMFRDSRTYLVMKITSLISFIAQGGFLSTTLLLALISYRWVWRLYEIIVNRYLTIQKELAFAFLMIPSVVFWGSGIMKDTFTFNATCYSFCSVYNIFIAKKDRVKNLIFLSLAVYIILSIKSYILFALLPGLIVFTNFERIKSVGNIFTKIIVIPSVFVGLLFLLQIFLVDFSELFGRYSADRILEEAVIQQQDLKRDVYGSNSFDIGDFKPTLGGALAKFPLAVNAAVFRPYIWETGSATMLISGIENSIISIISIYFLLILGPFKILSYIFKDPYLIFCLLFTLILGFGVGLSTSNFGALVRYKIPFMPFFISLIFILNAKRKENKKLLLK
jgi:hypothetical protein